MIDFEIIGEYCSFCKKYHFYSDNNCCGCKTNKCEYYMIKHFLWKKITTTERYLCFKCVEKRLKRKLRKSDFLKAPINIIKGHIPINFYKFTKLEKAFIKRIVNKEF